MTLVLAAKYRENKASGGIVFISDTISYANPPEHTRKVRYLDIPIDCPKFALGLAGKYHDVDETFSEITGFLESKILEDGPEYIPSWLTYHLTDRYSGFGRKLKHQLVAIHYGDHSELFAVNRNRRRGVETCDYSWIGHYYPEVLEILKNSYTSGMNLEQVTHLLQRAFNLSKKLSELTSPPRNGEVTLDLEGELASIKLTHHSIRKIAKRKELHPIEGCDLSVLTSSGLVYH